MITDQEKNENYSLLQKLIQNKCVNPPGDELRSIETIQSLLKENGITSEVFTVSPNRACLLAKIEGSDPHAPQLILGPAHVDVVPVTNPEVWTHDPFGGEIIDGFIYGRGSADMLSQVATQVLTFIKIYREKIPLKGNLYLWIVPDEELMGEMGAKWFLKNHKDKFNLSADKKTFALSEGAGAILFNYFNIYGIGQKGPLWKKLTFKGTPGHGSAPWHTDNAIVKASIAAQRFQEYNERIDKDAVDLTYVGEMAKIFSKRIDIFKDLVQKDTFARGLENLYKVDPMSAGVLHSITKNTFSPTIIHAGTNTNIIPDRAELTLDIRAMPNVTEAEIEKEIYTILGDLGKEVTIESTGDITEFVQGTASPSDSSLFRIAKNIIKEMYPEIDFVPVISAGATDARFCRLEGIECYELGISDPKVQLSDKGPAHGTDEKMDLSSMDYYFDFLYKLVVEFNQ